MLLAANIGFLALVAPAQIFYALSFNPLRDIQSPEEYKSFIIQGNIYQCLINTYYAGSFIFCFASSSVFRHEIKQFFQKLYKPRHVTNRVITLRSRSLDANRYFRHEVRNNEVMCAIDGQIDEYDLTSMNLRPLIQSTTDGNGLLEK